MAALLETLSVCLSVRPRAVLQHSGTVCCPLSRHRSPHPFPGRSPALGPGGPSPGGPGSARRCRPGPRAGPQLPAGGAAALM